MTVTLELPVKASSWLCVINLETPRGKYRASAIEIKWSPAFLNYVSGPILGWKYEKWVNMPGRVVLISRETLNFDTWAKLDFTDWVFCLFFMLIWPQLSEALMIKVLESVFTAHSFSDFLYTCNHVSLSWSLINKTVVHFETCGCDLFQQLNMLPSR